MDSTPRGELQENIFLHIMVDSLSEYSPSTIKDLDKRISSVTIEKTEHMNELQIFNYFMITSSPGHRVLSKYCGKLTGMKLAAELKLNSINQAAEKLEEIFSNLNIGTIKLKKMRDVHFRMYGCILSSGLGDMDVKMDDYVSGIIEGFLNKTLRESYEVREVRCLANGNEFCEFRCVRLRDN